MCKLATCFLSACMLLAAHSVIASGGPIKAYKTDFVTVATLEDIAPANGDNSVPPEYAACPATPNPPNTVFSVGFTSGLTYIDNVLHGLEWQGGSGPDIYLYTMANSFCATGTRVGATPVGFTNLESLAYCAADGFLYSVDFSFPAHMGRLIRINPATGTGTPIGTPMGFDVRIMGMTCDAVGNLWAITSGHGGRATELYTVDRNTGIETLVGLTGTATLTMEALEWNTSGTTAELLAARNSLYKINSSTGAATLIGGTYDTIWSMAQIRKTQSVDSDGDGVDDAVDNCTDIANADQRDTDDDDIGNICDPDVDGAPNCFVNLLDLNVYRSNFFVSGDLDTDNNGDNSTNLIDLNVLRNFFFREPGPSAIGCN